MSNLTILEEYKLEYKAALRLKKAGETMISAVEAGTDSPITIDEYIAMWKAGIDAMESGADPEQFAY